MSYAYDNLRLEKGMYGEAGRSFTQALEAADPSENYRGTPLEGLDAFQRQLKRFGQPVRCGGEVLPDHGVGGAVPGVRVPDRAAGYGGGQCAALHYRHHHPI